MHRARSIACLLLAPALLACGSDGGGDPRWQRVPAFAASTTEIFEAPEAQEECAPRALEGIDVSDGQGAVDWESVADAGVVFAMIKATQGTYDVQSTFGPNWSGAARSGIRRGAYHFFDPTEDGVSQARRFLSTMGALGPSDLPPVLDVECPDGDADCLGTGQAGAAPSAAIAERMWAWIGSVEAATGRKPIVYTFASYFASSGVDPAGLDAYPLFLAYPTSPTGPTHALSYCFPVPSPWKSAALWQYSWSGHVSGIATRVDRDRFLGSLAEFDAFAMPGSRGSGGAPAARISAAQASPAPDASTPAAPASGCD